jgi:hypothetical protein
MSAGATTTAAPPQAASAPAPQAPVGEFRPPQRGSRAGIGGIATRSWAPIALSFGSAVIVAIVLLIYFAEGWH